MNGIDNVLLVMICNLLFASLNTHYTPFIVNI